MARTALMRSGMRAVVGRGDYTKIGIGAVMALSIMALLFYRIPMSLGGILYITQNNWTGGGISANPYTLATNSNWTNYSAPLSSAPEATDLITSPTLKLKETGGTITHSTTNDFSSPANHNNTMEIGENVTLARSGDPTGIINLTTNGQTGKNSSIVQDQNRGLHVIFHDTSGTGSRLKYRFSPDGGQTWTGPYNIPLPSGLPGTPAITDYGYFNDLVVDTKFSRLYAIFRLNAGTVANGTNYIALIVASCSYATNGCTSWQSAVITSEAPTLANKFNYRFNYPTLAISNNGGTDPRLHLAYSLNSGFGYRNCALTSVAASCLSSGWSSSMDPSWNYMYSPRVVVDPRGGHYVYVISFLDSAGEDEIVWNSCPGSSSTSCDTPSEWVYNREPIGTGVIDINFNPIFSLNPSSLDANIDDDGYLHLVASAKDSADSSSSNTYRLLYRKSDEVVVGDGSISMTQKTITQWRLSMVSVLDNNIVRVFNQRLGSFYYPYIVYRNNSALWIAYYTGSGSENSCITTDDVFRLNYKCVTIESGGIGADVTLLDNTNPAIVHFNSLVLRYLSTPYELTGTFTSQAMDGGVGATWKSLTVTLSEALPSGTTLTVSARTTVNNVQETNSLYYCTLTPTISGTTYTFTGAEEDSFLLKARADPSCVWLQQNQQYLWYQISMTSDTLRTKTPVVAQVTAEYRRFPKSVSLTSSPFQMSNNTADMPAVKEIRWKEKIPSGKSARVSLQVRTATSSSSASFGSASWYGSGTSAYNAVSYPDAWTAPTGVFTTTDLNNGGCTRTLASDTSGNTPAVRGAVNLVSCKFDSQNPVFKDGKLYAQYRVTLAAPEQDATSEISEVQIVYGINAQPSVTVTSVSQAYWGPVTVKYDLSDSDNSSFNVGLFYDVRLRLLSNISSTDGVITVDTGTLSLAALVPPTGVIQIDDEQIKYFKIKGNSFVKNDDITPNIDLVRGATWWLDQYGAPKNSNPDSHSAGATVWIRATDAQIQNDPDFTSRCNIIDPIRANFCKTARASGAVGGGVTSGTNKTITWDRPALDIPGSIYMTDKNIMVSANDGEVVRQVRARVITSDFTIDTKKPQIDSNALDIPLGNGVFLVNGKLKTNTRDVTLSIDQLDVTNDGPLSDSSCNTAQYWPGYGKNACYIMVFCNTVGSDTCGTPKVLELILNQGNLPWTPYPSSEPFATSKSLTLNDSSQSAEQTVKVGVFDIHGNISFSSKNIVLDASPTGNPPAPPTFTAEDISNASKPLVYLRWDDISASLQLQDAYGGDFAKFKIYRAQGAAPNTNGTPLAELTTASLTNYVDGGVAYDTAYSYALVVEDNVGNRSSPINANPNSITPTSTGLTIPSPPIITAGGYPAVELTTTSAKITWDTDKASDSKVVYAGVQSKPSSFDGYPSQGSTALATSGTDAHNVTLVGLQPGTRYFYEIRSAVSGNSTPGTKNSEGGTDFQFSTLTPPPVVKPVISGVGVSLTHNSATFTWTTDLDSDSFVQYGADAGLTNSTFVGQQDSIKNHTVTISSLLPQTTYYFRLNSTAGEGTGIAPSTGNSLSGGTNFSCSSSSCSAMTAVDPKDDQPPTYDNIQVSNIQYNTATITWTTNEPATSFVEFWKSGDTTHRFWPSAPGSLVVSHTVQLPLDLEPDTDYSFQVISVDGSTNSVPSAEQAPFHTEPQPTVITPPAFTGPTIRHDTITATTATIYFRTDQPTSTIVHYSINDQSYIQQQLFPELITDHTVMLLNLTPGTTYYYKVKATNSSGLSTESTDCGGSLCYFTTMTSTNPLPLIIEGSLSVTDITPNIATIGWRTVLPGDSFVEFGPADASGNPLYGRTFGYVSDSKTEHTVTLPNDLLSGQTYYFRVRTRDVYSQLAVYPGTIDPSVTTCAPTALDERNPCFTTTVSDQILISESATPPIISGVGALLVTDVKAIIGWSTDKLADSEVNYGLSTSYGAPIKQVDAADKPIYTRAHAVALENLQPSTDYYFKVASTSLLPADMRIEDDKGGQGYTFKTNAGTGQYSQAPGQQGAVKLDTTPPVLSSVIVDKLTNTTATIKWNTNEQSTSVVKFGETDSYGRLAGDYSALTNDHTVVLQKLDAGTEYHFKAYSCDREANCAESYDLTFTTRGTKSEKVKEKEGEEKATEEDGDDTKGKEELDEATKRIQALSKDRKLSVEKIIELLKDFSEEEVSKILSSIGLQLVSPPKFVAGAPRIEVTTTTATITWQTDREADSRVAYVTDADYKSDADDPYHIEAGDMSNFTTDHAVTLIGLQPNTVYHYQVRSREPAGRTARSKDYTFKTLPMKPEITDLKIAETTERAATLTWKTNVPTTSIVTYENLKNNAQRSQGDPQFVTIHRFTLQDLEVSSFYEASIRAEDESGLSIISGSFKFSTKRDIVPPEIIQVRTDVTLSPGKSEFAQAIITWRTNEPSTSQVLYEEGITQSQTLKNASPESTEHLLNHVVILNKLRPATVYRFRVGSMDPTGNKAESRDFTLLTPQKKETVLEIIIKNFEDTFGFLKSFGQ